MLVRKCRAVYCVQIELRKIRDLFQSWKLKQFTVRGHLSKRGCFYSKLRLEIVIYLASVP